jgi:hypothetical protein
VKEIEVKDMAFSGKNKIGQWNDIIRNLRPTPLCHDLAIMTGRLNASR